MKIALLEWTRSKHVFLGLMLGWTWVLKQLFLHRFDNCSMFPYLFTPGFKVVGCVFPQYQSCRPTLLHSEVCPHFIISLFIWLGTHLFVISHTSKWAFRCWICSSFVGIVGCVGSEFFMRLLTEVHIACISSSTKGLVVFLASKGLLTVYLCLFFDHLWSISNDFIKMSQLGWTFWCSPRHLGTSQNDRNVRMPQWPARRKERQRWKNRRNQAAWGRQLEMVV
jgi:hypothetical protein